jgi:hypothetical protein
MRTLLLLILITTVVILAIARPWIIAQETLIESKLR